MSERKYNAALQDRLRRFIDLKQLTQDGAGQLFGYSGTAIGKYLGGKFDGNLARLESVLIDGLKRSAECGAQSAESNLFDTYATEKLRKICLILKRNHWMGAAYGDAGIGKTCGANKFLLTDLSAIFITIVVYRRNRQCLTNLLWAQAGSDMGINIPRMDYIEQKLRGTDRIIIVDQAHLLNRMGRQFFCDLWDATKVPILFIGNPEMFQEWRASQQQASRLRINEKIALETVMDHDEGKHTTERAAVEMVRRIAPAAEAELRSRALRVAKGEGHLRSLETSLQLATRIRELEGGTWAAAFDAAESQQVRNYEA